MDYIEGGPEFMNRQVRWAFVGEKARAIIYGTEITVSEQIFSMTTTREKS
jgi:hypothetical protein